LPCYLVPLRSKYAPQHLIFERPQPTFLPQCQRRSFTPIRHNIHIERNRRELTVCAVLAFALKKRGKEWKLCNIIWRGRCH
jgi:hypothetical protein